MALRCCAAAVISYYCIIPFSPVSSGGDIDRIPFFFVSVRRKLSVHIYESVADEVHTLVVQRTHLLQTKTANDIISRRPFSGYLSWLCDTACLHCTCTLPVPCLVKSVPISLTIITLSHTSFTLTIRRFHRFPVWERTRFFQINTAYCMQRNPNFTTHH